MAAAPLRYDPALEHSEDNEAATAAEIVRTMRGISDTTFKDYGHVVRRVHAKSHGLLRGTLQVLDGWPETLAQGLFATPGRHPVVMRLSTSPGDLLDDAVSFPRGLALKVLDVEGERLPGAEGRTQDFVMVNGPAFQSATAAAFPGSLKLLAAITDTPQAWKKAFSAAARGAEAAVEAVGGKSATLLGLGGHPLTNTLGETFPTQVPVLYGPFMAKLSLVPVSPGLVVLKDAKVDPSGRPNGPRDAIRAHFRAQGGEWELRAQLCTNLDSMPIRTPRFRGRKGKVPTSPWPGSLRRRRTTGPNAAQPRWTTACCSVPGTGWRRTGRSDR